MPLRVRLSLAFVIIVIVPLSVTALLIEFVLARNLDTGTRDRLGHGTEWVSSVLQQYEKRAQASALAVSATPGLQDAVRDGRTNVARVLVARHLEGIRGAGVDADFTAIISPEGDEIVAFGRAPQFRPGTAAPPVATLAPEATRSSYAVVGRALLLLQGADARDLGTVVSGFWLDDLTLRQLTSNASDIELTAVADGKPVASTLIDDNRIAALAEAKTSDAPRRVDDLFASRLTLRAGGDVVLSTRRESLLDQQKNVWPTLVLVVLLFVLLAALLGWLLARLTTKPLQELSEAAMDIASGKHDTRIVLPPSGEVGRLAIAFNAMADEVSGNIAELQSSRDELRRNLTRLGETLSSTHDLNKMLDVVLETAKVTLRAEAGALMLFTANRDELYIKSWLGDPQRRDGVGRVKVGEGVAGMVGRTGEPLHGPIGDVAGGLTLADGEPRARAVIAVPLRAHGRTLGVLNLYDKEGARDFDADDFTTIRSFANQATVAIDNVLLHQESQRLSITDGLTGLWNYRYFQMMFDKEIERASRFGRPLSLLMLDLDKFKNVNDTHGHQRGDSVLIELATRIKGGIREVDTLARYGGEEFVLILPETDLHGAEQAAGKLCELVRQRSFGNTDETALRLTVSIGVAVYPEHGSTPGMLVRAADSALYVAKSNGRDQYSIGAPGSEIDEDTSPKLPPLDGRARSALESAAASVGTPRVAEGDQPLGSA